MTKKIIPNSFQCPNAYVDEFMRYLTGDEFKVLTVIVRQTFGWQKRKAAISESLIASFTGLSRNTAGNASDALCKFGLIVLVTANDPATNKGNVYAPQFRRDRIDVEGLDKRMSEKKDAGKRRISKARASRSTSGSATTPPSGSATTPPSGSATSTEKPIESQYENQGASAASAAPPVGITYEAKDIGNMTTTNKTFVDVQMDWIERNDENVRRLKSNAKSETALSASLEFYRVSGIKVLPHGAKNRLAGGQALYEASGGNLTLIEKAYNQLKSSNAWVTDEWSLVKTVNVLASEAPTPANTGASLVEWVTTPAGKILRYDGVPYPGDAGRQKCVELGIAYEGGN